MERVDVLDKVEHAVGSGRFHNLHFFSRALIFLRSFLKFKIVMVSSISLISCPAFRICLEKVDFPVEVAKFFQCSLNLVLKFLFVLPMYTLLQIIQAVHLRLCNGNAVQTESRLEFRHADEDESSFSSSEKWR